LQHSHKKKLQAQDLPTNRVSMNWKEQKIIRYVKKQKAAEKTGYKVSHYLR
jgi:hypothetical protein